MVRSKKLIALAVVSLIASLLVLTAFAVNSNEREKDKPAKEFKLHEINDISALTAVLGIDKGTLKEELHNGATAYEMLTEAGKLDEYKQLWLDAGESKLNKLVSHNKLTREQADARYEEYKAAVDNWDGAVKMEKIFKTMKK